MNAPQRLVVRQPRATCVRHLIVQFSLSGAAKHFVNELARKHAPALASDAGPGAVELAIGLSFQGLRALNLPLPYQAALARLAPAFAQGAPLRAAEFLGDTGPSAATAWEPGFGLVQAHAVITLHAGDEPALQEASTAIEELARSAKVAIVGRHHGARLPRTRNQQGEWVHFGYRDGLTHVHVQGYASDAAAPAHATGELLLGHANDASFNPWALPLSPAPMRGFFANASFGVLRKMHQDEPLFRQRLGAWAKQLKQTENFVRAKLCGRWPEGGLIDATGQAPVSTAAPPGADFNFDADPDGLGCPFGAHIRRMNPRGQGVVHTRPRPLVRRGMPYGPVFNEAAEEPVDTQRGLLGLFFCASLEEQFEHVLGQWADRNPIGPHNPGQAKDPFAATHDDPQAAFAVPLGQGQPPALLRGFAPFVTTRGTVYLFYPAQTAWSMLCSGQDYAEDGQPGSFG